MFCLQHDLKVEEILFSVSWRRFAVEDGGVRRRVGCPVLSCLED